MVVGAGLSRLVAVLSSVAVTLADAARRQSRFAGRVSFPADRGLYRGDRKPASRRVRPAGFSFRAARFLAASDVLAFVDAGIERVAARIARLVLALYRVRRKDVHQERLDSVAVLLAAGLAPAGEGSGKKPFREKNAAGLVDVGHVVAPWSVDAAHCSHRRLPCQAINGYSQRKKTALTTGMSIRGFDHHLKLASRSAIAIMARTTMVMMIAAGMVAKASLTMNSTMDQKDM